MSNLVPTNSKASIGVTKCALVFVPGVMGSRFTTETGWTWDPDSLSVTKEWFCRAAVMRKKLGLQCAGPGTLIKTPAGKSPVFGYTKLDDDQIRRCFPTLRMASYGPFITALDDDCKKKTFGPNVQLTVYAYGYDWRKPVEQLGKELASDIAGGADNTGIYPLNPLVDPDDGEGFSKVLFITHSMGGLVVRAALKRSPKLQAMTAGVLHGVQPATGATVFYRRCITGCVKGWDGDGVFIHLLGSDGPSFATVCSDLPGPINLFPSARLADDLRKANGNVGLMSWRKFDAAPDVLETLKPPQTPTLYEMAKRNEKQRPPGCLRSDITESARDDLRQNLEDTEVLHRSLSVNGDSAGEPWLLKDKTWAFYGRGLRTDCSMHFDLPPVAPRKRRNIFLQVEYHATDASGNEATFSQKQLDWAGYCAEPDFSQEAWRGNSGNRIGLSAFGDSTVPDASGSALFGGSDEYKSSAATDFEVNRQFYFQNLEHEPAYRQPPVQQLVRDWLKFIVNSRLRKTSK